MNICCLGWFAVDTLRLYIGAYTEVTTHLHFLHFILDIYASNYVGNHLFDILTAAFFLGDFFFCDLQVSAIQFFRPRGATFFRL